MKKFSDNKDLYNFLNDNTIVFYDTDAKEALVQFIETIDTKTEFGEDITEAYIAVPDSFFEVYTIGVDLNPMLLEKDDEGYRHTVMQDRYFVAKKEQLTI